MVELSMSVKSYKDLVVWQESILLVKQVYLLTKSFPADEKVGLVSQMRRASGSVSSDIAEGHARNTTGEFIQFISLAEGSAAELETQLLLAIEPAFATTREANPVLEMTEEVQRMLNGLRAGLRKRTQEAETGERGAQREKNDAT